MTKRRLTYASVQSPDIQAILARSFRFAERALAEKKIKALEARFFRSKHQPQTEDGHNLILWIRGFEVTEDEQSQRIIGNYALISPKQLPDGAWTLTATKLNAEPGLHPQRQRPKAMNPNWAHPVIKAAQKGKAYKTLASAMAELEKLHQEFPETTIPVPPKLYVMIYTRLEDKKVEMQKHVMEVVVLDNGTYRLSLVRNAPLQDASAALPEPAGKFSQKIAMKRKFRKPTA